MSFWLWLSFFFFLFFSLFPLLSLLLSLFALPPCTFVSLFPTALCCSSPFPLFSLFSHLSLFSPSISPSPSLTLSLFLYLFLIFLPLTSSSCLYVSLFLSPSPILPPLSRLPLSPPPPVSVSLPLPPSGPAPEDDGATTCMKKFIIKKILSLTNLSDLRTLDMLRGRQEVPRRISRSLLERFQMRRRPRTQPLPPRLHGRGVAARRSRRARSRGGRRSRLRQEGTGGPLLCARARRCCMHCMMYVYTHAHVNC